MDLSIRDRVQVTSFLEGRFNTYGEIEFYLIEIELDALKDEAWLTYYKNGSRLTWAISIP